MIIGGWVEFWTEGEKECGVFEFSVRGPSLPSEIGIAAAILSEVQRRNLATSRLPPQTPGLAHCWLSACTTRHPKERCA